MIRLRKWLARLLDPQMAKDQLAYNYMWRQAEEVRNWCGVTHPEAASAAQWLINKDLYHFSRGTSKTDILPSRLSGQSIGAYRDWLDTNPFLNDIEAKHRAEIADTAEKFRAVNIGRVIEQLGLLVNEKPEFQDRVSDAHHALFHDDPTDIEERRARFLEEVYETVQAFGMSEQEAVKLAGYSFNRPVGEPNQEIGGAMVTLASLCIVAGYDLMECAEADLEKLQRPETIERIRAKRATRHGRGPLPGLSAETCPDCGRQKARDVGDARNGLCPKWWAIHDADAFRDCVNHAKINETRENP